MLLDLFKEKRCFKLVCGAGNEDAIEVEKLVTLYSLAGCNFFDLCAKPEIVDAAKRGLKRAGIEKERYLCVSVGLAGDQHFSKALIKQDSCIKCGKCQKSCLHDAIDFLNNIYEVNTMRCIGCRLCYNKCPQNTIEMVSKPKDLKEVLPPLVEKGIDCIEIHLQGEDEAEVDSKWQDIMDCFDGPLSICTDRSRLGDVKIIERVKRMLEKREPYSTIVQADGIPMTGGEDTYGTTLQSVATAQLFQNADLPIHLLLSGGTNSKTTELAKMCDIHAGGVAIGTFARRIVKEYVEREDFFENEAIFTKALKIAKGLVDISKENLK